MEIKPVVLIADSNARPASLIEELIASSLDVRCVRIQRSESVLASIDDLSPVALVIDSDFGGADCGFLQQLARSRPRLMKRTLMLTDDARTPGVSDAIHSMGLFGFCEKPIRGRELVQALEMCISGDEPRDAIRPSSTRKRPGKAAAKPARSRLLN